MQVHLYSLLYHQKCLQMSWQNRGGIVQNIFLYPGVDACCCAIGDRCLPTALQPFFFFSPQLTDYYYFFPLFHGSSTDFAFDLCNE